MSEPGAVPAPPGPVLAADCDSLTDCSCGLATQLPGYGVVAARRQAWLATAWFIGGSKAIQGWPEGASQAQTPPDAPSGCDEPACDQC